MYEIYTHTSHNLIYLGPDDSNMLKVGESVEAILREISLETRDYEDFGEMVFQPNGVCKFSNVPFSIDISQSGLIEFFENPWFDRLWVVQEASLSRLSTCHIGQARIPLASVLRVALWLSRKRRQMPNTTLAQKYSLLNAELICDLSDRAYGRYHPHQFLLWEFLFLFTHFHTHDRRDKVSALLALWQRNRKEAGLPAVLEPDCTLSVSEMYRNAARFAIQERNDLTLLQDVCISPHGKRNELWQSWVAVLDRGLLSLDYPLRLGNQGFAADHREGMQLFTSTDEPNTLDVAGLLVDTVIGMTSYPTQRTASASNTFMASAEDFRAKCIWVEGLGGDIETRVGIVLQAGSRPDRKRANDQEALRSYQTFKSYLKDHSSLPPHPFELKPSASDGERAAAHYGEIWHRAAFHRAIFYTEDGHLGLGPESTQPGDVVAILYGCQWPVVMRPLPTPGEYTFLECAYVYGIMDGEAVRKLKEIGREDDRFRII